MKKSTELQLLIQRRTMMRELAVTNLDNKLAKIKKKFPYAYTDETYRQIRELHMHHVNKWFSQGIHEVF